MTLEQIIHTRHISLFAIFNREQTTERYKPGFYKSRLRTYTYVRTDNLDVVVVLNLEIVIFS